jgi:L-ascorbate metabolism protein UlaG (beta-lactamase superfamily)
MILRWLGVAGIDLRVAQSALVIDPFFTRFPLWRALLGPVRPAPEPGLAHLPDCDAILVSHTHWDHAMDVPPLARRTGARVVGSPNTCRLAAASGVPAGRIREVGAGARVAQGPFQVTVLPAAHVTWRGRRVLAGPMGPDLRPPLWAWQYRMDHCFSFLVEAQGLRLLDWCGASWDGAPPADVLLVQPFYDEAYYEALLERVRPRLVVPVHWDDFMRPLSAPLRPGRRPPADGRLLPARVNLDTFRETLRRVAPAARVLVPERFGLYVLEDVLR